MKADDHAQRGGILSDYSRRVMRGARAILTAPDGVKRLDPDHYKVAPACEGGQAVRVYRRGDGWRCASDRRHDAARPCAHILAVMETVGAVRLPATISPRAEAARRDAIEAEAARILPDRLPVLLARMLDASPAATPPKVKRGRPRCSPHALAYQAVMLAAHRGAAPAPGPYGAASRNTLKRFLADHETGALLRGLLEWTLAAARPLDATRPDACNQGTLTFTTPSEPLVMHAAWTPTYELLARLEPATEPSDAAPGAQDAASRFAALVGCDLTNRHATAQENEARCAALAHNLARLAVIDLERSSWRPASSDSAPQRGCEHGGWLR